MEALGHIVLSSVDEFLVWVGQHVPTDSNIGFDISANPSQQENAMELSAKAVDAMNTIDSPEEAYKVFAGAVSEGLGQLLADSLAKALGAASISATNPKIVGWEKYVRGLTMQCVWGTPGFRTIPSVAISSASAVIGSTAKPSIAGGSITIGGSWTF